MRHLLYKIVSDIQKQERKFSVEASSFIDEAYRMTVYLKELLGDVKEDIINEGFATKEDEILFFKQIKPTVLGKLIYYNKVFRIESACPASSGNVNSCDVHPGFLHVDPPRLRALRVRA